MLSMQLFPGLGEASRSSFLFKGMFSVGFTNQAQLLRTRIKNLFSWSYIKKSISAICRMDKRSGSAIGDSLMLSPYYRCVPDAEDTLIAAKLNKRNLFSNLLSALQLATSEAVPCSTLIFPRFLPHRLRRMVHRTYVCMLIQAWAFRFRTFTTRLSEINSSLCWSIVLPAVKIDWKCAGRMAVIMFGAQLSNDSTLSSAVNKVHVIVNALLPLKLVWLLSSMKLLLLCERRFITVISVFSFIQK